MIKCSVLPNENLLVAIIRRIDLDADAKLNFKEFIDAIRPIENFTVKKASKPKVSDLSLSRPRPKSSLLVRERRNRRLDQSAGSRTITNFNFSPDREQRSILKKSATNEKGFDKFTPIKSHDTGIQIENQMTDEKMPSNFIS